MTEHTQSPTDAPSGPDDATDLQERVEAALRTVRDPDAEVNVFEAGLVESIDVEVGQDDDGRHHDGENGSDDDAGDDSGGGAVVVGANVAEFDDEHAQGVMRAMLGAVRDVPGVDRAHVEPVVPTTTDEDTGVAGFDTVIAVASAKGGVGKSTIATGLACALAADEGTGLLDADVHGPNVPELLDVSGPIHSDDEGNPLPVSVAGAEATLDVMSVGLMESSAPLAWRGAMAHDALTELFETTAWTADDTLVVDLPPGTGDVVLTTLQEVAVDGVVVVTTPYPASLADTRRSVDLFRDNDVPVLGAVINMGSFTCPSCGDTHDLFPGSSPAETLPAPVLAEVPFETELQETPTPGSVPAPMARLADAVRDAAETAWEVDVPDDAVDIRGDAPETRRERVRSRFTALDSGATFTLVSDRDPTPVREFLARLADCRPADVDAEVERRTPADWVLTATRP
jgi:ATP-binding protein involved in chromosome partitioning